MWEKLFPDLILGSIYELDTEFLREKGIRGIILDMDNTLVPWGSCSVNPRVCRWVDSLKEEGFTLFVVSNSTPGKGKKLAEEIGVPAVWYSVKPWRWAFRYALKKMGLKPGETAIIGDQIFTDVLGGKRMGLFTILVPQLGKKDYLWTRLMRKLEELVFRRMKEQGYLDRNTPAKV